MSNIKNIIFDIGNVLVEWNPEKLAKSVFDNPDEAQAAVRYVYSSPYWPVGDTGELSPDGFIALLTANAPAEYAHVIGKALEYFPLNIELKRDEINRGIALAGAGYNIYLLTNFNYRFTDFLPRLPLKDYICGYVCSCDTGTAKPDPAIYRILLDKYSLVAEECLFFDDVAVNVEAARKLGINAVLYTGDPELIKV